MAAEDDKKDQNKTRKGNPKWYKGMPCPSSGRPKGAKDGKKSQRSRRRTVCQLIDDYETWLRNDKQIPSIGAEVGRYAEENPEFKEFLMRAFITTRLTPDIDPIAEDLKREEIAAMAGQRADGGGGGGTTTINVVTPALLPSPGLRTPASMDVEATPVPQLPAEVDNEGSPSDAQDVPYEDL